MSTAVAQKPGGAAPSAGPGPTDPGPKITATQKDICQGGSTILSATPGNVASTNVTYTWTPNQDLSSATGPEVVVNPLKTTTYTVAINISGSISYRPVTIVVNEDCCQYSAAQKPPKVVELGTYYDDYPLPGPSSGDPFSYDYSSGTAVPRPAGTYFHVAGTSLTLRNGNFTLPPGSVLLLEGGADLILDDARLNFNGGTVTAACNEMWGELSINDDGYGITANAVGTLRPRLMHSRGGVVLDGKYSVGINIQIDQMDFLHNYHSLALRFDPMPATTADYITKCVFDSDFKLMKAPYKATGTNYWYSQEHVSLSGDVRPANFKGNAFKHALLGLNLIDTGAIPALKVEACQFSDLYLAGITSGHQSITPQPGYSLEVIGSQFTFPKETALPATAQVSQTLAANAATLNPNETVGIGAQNIALTVTASTFTQPDAGPYATFNYPAYRPRQVGVASTQLVLATDNTFQTLAVGLRHAPSSGTAEVRGNQFSACEKGLNLAGSSGVAYVSCNSFLRGVTSSVRSGVSYGIYSESNSVVTLANPAPGGNQVLKNLELISG